MPTSFQSSTFDGSATGATTQMSVYTTPASTETVGLSLLLTNIHTATVEIKVRLIKSVGDDVFIAFNWPIPAGGSIEAIEGKFIMEAADQLTVESDTANSIDSTFSYMEST